MKCSGILIIALLGMSACGDTKDHFNPAAVRQQCSDMLHNYHRDIGEKGLMAEFNYLDTSADFFWVPPGFTAPLTFNTVRQMVGENARKYKTVKLNWDNLEVRPLSPDIANFSGLARGIWTDTNGVTTEFSFVESGSLIRREDGWKLLSGQTALLPQGQ